MGVLGGCQLLLRHGSSSVKTGVFLLNIVDNFQVYSRRSGCPRMVLTAGIGQTAIPKYRKNNMEELKKRTRII
jgi:hypothetical protein